jgi:hypothetical protein
MAQWPSASATAFPAAAPTAAGEAFDCTLTTTDTLAGAGGLVSFTLNAAGFGPYRPIHPTRAVPTARSRPLPSDPARYGPPVAGHASAHLHIGGD